MSLENAFQNLFIGGGNERLPENDNKLIEYQKLTIQPFVFSVLICVIC
jgi:hypothetical protein